MTSYDRDYIWELLSHQFVEEGFSQSALDLVMMPFDERYRYALKQMRYARSAESVADYVFNGLYSDWTNRVRREKEK